MLDFSLNLKNINIFLRIVTVMFIIRIPTNSQRAYMLSDIIQNL